MNYLKLFINCFFNRNPYIEVQKNEKNVIPFFLIFVISISSPFIISFWMQSNKFINNELQEIIYQIPDIQITNGILSTPNNSSYSINTKNKVLCIIDPTKSIYSDLNPEPAKFRICRDGLIAIKTNNQIQITPFSNTITYQIDAIKAQHYISFYPLIFIVFILIYIIGKCIVLLFYSLIHIITGKILSSIHKVHISTTQLFNQILIASIPAIMLETIIHFINQKTNIWFVYFIITIVYLNFSISSLKTIQSIENTREV